MTDNHDLRARLLLDRPILERRRIVADLTLDEALADLRRYRELYPDAAPEVIAVELFRHADGWDDCRTILAALDTILKEDKSRGR